MSQPTKLDIRTLAILYCLYGHEPFVWAGKGKFQWYFGITKRAKNRLAKCGWLQRQEHHYAPHWLAYRAICAISPGVRFDDQAIEQAISQARADLITRGYDYVSRYKPYPINDPEYASYIEVEPSPEFVALVARLPKQSKYLIGDDGDRLCYRAHYWPDQAVEAAIQTIQFTS